MPNASSPGLRPGAYRVDDQVGHLLRLAYQRASGNLAARLAAHRLTVPQFAVLARLRERDGLSQNALGRLVAMEPANIHAVVRRLAGRGLVVAGPAASDRRRRLLSLSAAGRALVTRLLPRARAASAATRAPLAPAERAILLDLLRRVAAPDSSGAP